jgi:hypothetical protein
MNEKKMLECLPAQKTSKSENSGKRVHRTQKRKEVYYARAARWKKMQIERAGQRPASRTWKNRRRSTEIAELLHPRSSSTLPLHERDGRRRGFETKREY